MSEYMIRTKGGGNYLISKHRDGFDVWAVLGKHKSYLFDAEDEQDAVSFVYEYDKSIVRF